MLVHGIDLSTTTVRSTFIKTLMVSASHLRSLPLATGPGTCAYSHLPQALAIGYSAGGSITTAQKHMPLGHAALCPLPAAPVGPPTRHAARPRCCDPGCSPAACLLLRCSCARCWPALCPGRLPLACAPAPLHHHAQLLLHWLRRLAPAAHLRLGVDRCHCMQFRVRSLRRCCCPC